MLEKNSPKPLYQQLKDILVDAIDSEKWKANEKIPSENELSSIYGLSRMTVRSVLTDLVKEGLLYRVQGKGTFVTKPKYSRNMKKLQSFTEMCEQMGVKPGARVLENRLIAADKKVADRLGIEPGSNVVYISRLRLADGEPVQVEKSYFPLKYAFLLEEDLNDGSMFECLKEKAGAKVASSEKMIELCRATAEEAALMDVKKGDYLLFVKSTAYDENGEPMYAGIQLINGDRFSLYVYESGK